VSGQVAWPGCCVVQPRAARDRHASYYSHNSQNSVRKLILRFVRILRATRHGSDANVSPGGEPTGQDSRKSSRPKGHACCARRSPDNVSGRFTCSRRSPMNRHQRCELAAMLLLFVGYAGMPAQAPKPVEPSEEQLQAAIRAFEKLGGGFKKETDPRTKKTNF